MNLFRILLALLLLTSSLHAAEKPNVVIILSDDQAWTDYGFMGHEAIKTPHPTNFPTKHTASLQFVFSYNRSIT